MGVDSVSGLNGSQTKRVKHSKITLPGLPEGWLSENEVIKSHDGACALFGAFHQAQDFGAKRVLVVLHGFGEHGGRYLHLPHYLHPVVDGVYCLDQRGHGRAEGLRGHVKRFDDFADDAAVVIRHLYKNLKHKFGRAEIHLVGHSLGGHVALRTAMLHPDLPLASVLVSAPFLGLKMQVPLVKRALAKVLDRAWGSLQLQACVDPAFLSHDPEVVKAYRDDRLVHGRMTPHFFESMRAAQADTFLRAAEKTAPFETPVNLLVPLADEIVSVADTDRFFATLNHPDKHMKTFAGFYHEIMNELGKEEVFAEISRWLASFDKKGKHHESA
jgi:alpha-beta hydrolase superfamily lysophospholipase